MTVGREGVADGSSVVSLVRDRAHRRYDPLADRWVLVSAGRDVRPWLGETEDDTTTPLPRYDPDCYLCPGNARARGDVNPEYTATHWFTNDFPALHPNGAETTGDDGLLRVDAVDGTCRVLCFSPRHDLTLADMEQNDVRSVVDLWSDQVEELSERYQWVQVFENRGAAMGASNPHPHGQLWASSALPHEAVVEDRTQLDHFETTGRGLLDAYLATEVELDERVVDRQGAWVSLVPHWAVWPFEVMLIPTSNVSHLSHLDDGERHALAILLRRTLAAYNRLFETPMPYSMGWHGSPGARVVPHWRLHGHVYPPMLTPTRRKFMVGYEMLAEPQRDITPEAAAERLREALRRHDDAR